MGLSQALPTFPLVAARIDKCDLPFDRCTLPLLSGQRPSRWSSRRVIHFWRSMLDVNGNFVQVRGGALCGLQLSLEALIASFAHEPVGTIRKLPRGTGATIRFIASRDGARKLAAQFGRARSGGGDSGLRSNGVMRFDNVHDDGS